MDIVGRDVFQVDFIYFGTTCDVVCHAGWGGDIVYGPFGMDFQLCVGAGLARQTLLRGLLSPLVIDFADSLHYLEKSGSAADAVGFQRGRNCQTDGLLGTTGIGHD